MGTLYIGLLCGEKEYYISAARVYSRRAQFSYTYPNAINAPDLIALINKDVIFKQIRDDGSYEFHGCFEITCKRLRLCLLVLPPSSPKLNDRLESLNAMLVGELVNFWCVSDDFGKPQEHRTIPVWYQKCGHTKY